jgi:carbonic anhydrase
MREPLSPAEALVLLNAGHQRFLEGRSQPSHADRAHLHALAEAQHPMAAVLGCADSRVPVELLFDTGFGDLFVARNAGNVALAGMVGTLEYAVAVLKVPLIVVLGHERCGAVAAALRPGNLDLLPDSLAQLVGQIRLELLAAGIDHDLDHACRHNAMRAAQRLAGASVLINDRLRSGQLRIEAARYDLDDRRLDWLGTVLPITCR